MLTERLKSRLAKGRPMACVTLHIPVDVIEEMQEIARTRGFASYRTLLKAYLSEGLRRDEVHLAQPQP